MRTDALRQLQDRIASISERDRAQSGRVATPWGPALELGVAHEWFADTFPPVCLLSDLAARSTLERPDGGLVMWIGRCCWPYGPLLARWPGLLRCSVLIDAACDADRLWLIDIGARSPAVAAVVADAHGLGLAATRRIQLAAAVGGGLCLLARPLADLRTLSAASTRWAVAHEPTTDPRPRWSVALLRDKTSPAITDRSPRWLVEWRDEAGVVGVDPGVGGAACRAARAGLVRATA